MSDETVFNVLLLLIGVGFVVVGAVIPLLLIILK